MNSVSYLTSNNDIIMYIEDSGKIGIGKSNPSTIFDVSGVVNVSSNITLSNIVSLYDIVVSSSNKAVDASNTAYYALALGGGGGSNLILSSNFDYLSASNLYIRHSISNLGTAYFASNLTVVGTLNVDTINYTTSNVTIVSATTFQSNLYVGSNLGIGTSNPTAQLDVRLYTPEVGNVIVNISNSNAGEVYFRVYDEDIIGGKAHYNYNIATVTSNFSSNFGPAYYGSNVYVNCNLYVNGTQFNSNTLSNIGNAYFASNVNIYGITTLSNNTNIYGPSVFYGHATFSNNAAFSNHVDVYGSISNYGFTHFSSNIEVDGAAAFSNNVIFYRPTSNLSTSAFTAAMLVTGTSTFSNSVNTYGITSNFNVATFQSNVFFNGPFEFSNSVVSYGGTSFFGGLYTSNLIVGSNLTLCNMFILPRTSNVPPPASACNIHLYIDGDGLLKSENSAGIVKIYNPMSNKGDLLTHSGVTDVILPKGSNNQILFVDSNAANGISWKDLSTDTVAFDETDSKYLHVYSSTTTTVGTTSNLDVVFDVTRKRSADFFTYSNNTTLRFLVAGTYYIGAKICNETATGNTDTISSALLLYSSNAGSNYTELSNTVLFLNNIGANPSGGTAMFSRIYTVNSNDLIKIGSRVTTSTNVVRTRQNSIEWYVARNKVDKGSDNSTYSDYIAGSNFALTLNTFNPVPFYTTMFQSSSHTALSNNLAITFAEAGIYVVEAKINASGNALSAGVSKLQVNTGAGFTDVPGSLGYNFIQSALTSNNSTNISAIVNVNTSNTIRVVSSLISGTGMSVTSNSEIVIQRFRSVTNGQTLTDHYYASGSNNLTLTASYADVDLTNSNVFTSNFSYNTASNALTILEDGRYFINGRVSFINTSAATNSISTTLVRLVVDSGGGFNEISGTTGVQYISYSNFGYGTIPIFTTQELKAGARLKVQALRLNGTGIISTLSNATNLSVYKIDNPVSLDNVILRFGTYYSFGSSLGLTTTTSATYIEKLRLTTPTVPEGVYRISVAFQIADVATNKDVNVQVIVDDTSQIHESRIVYGGSGEPVYADIFQVSLIAGIHTIDVDFRANSGTAGLKNTKLEFWRAST